MPFGDEIAILDGLDLGGLNMTMSANSNFETRRNVIDPSEGGNYGGGSSYAPGLPLLPSSIGLAGADRDLVNFSRRTNVINPSGGANYSGGSNYTPGMPLITSGDPGLAGCVGRYDQYSDFDGIPLNRLDEFFGSSLTVEDGRIGKTPASGSEYAEFFSNDVSYRRNVIDPSEGGNYGGGSSYAPGLPLLPSSVGLAGLDAVPNSKFTKKLRQSKKAAFKRVAGKNKVERLKGMQAKLERAYPLMTPQQKQRAFNQLVRVQKALAQVRAVRQQIMSRPATA